MMSSGYRSLFLVCLGIVKEIELRRLGFADAFDGIILIDELDLHLHPQWQQEIAQILKALFPQAQFIVSTHSPHIVQAGEPGEILALARNSGGESKLQTNPTSAHGYRGWTIEEILSDVMGMSSITSRLYDSVMEEFEQAIESENGDKVRRTYDILMQMLHPTSISRKILKLQAAAYLSKGQ